jgi:hypothetical protein
MKNKYSKGTVEQMMAAIDRRITELGGNAAEELVSSAINIDEANFDERYIHTLIGDLDSELGEYFESLTFATTNDALIVTTVDAEDIHDFTVPYADLKFAYDKIDDDIEYICDEIREATDISAATNTVNVPAKPIIGEDDGEWTREDFKRLGTKKVRGIDGSLVTYSYYRRSDGKYVFMFDELPNYGPETGDYDDVMDSEREAWIQFELFEGVDENGNDLYNDYDKNGDIIEHYNFENSHE